MRVLLLWLLPLTKQGLAVLLPGWSSSGIHNVVQTWTLAFASMRQGTEFSLQVEDAIWRIGGETMRNNHSLSLPAASTYVAMVTSATTQPIETISKETVAAIYNGTIVSWAKVNSTWPDTPIRTVVRKDDAFETTIVSQALGVSLKEDWGYHSATIEDTSYSCIDSASLNTSAVSTQIESQSVDEMLSTLLRVPYSIGYLDIDRAQSFQHSLSIIGDAFPGTIYWDVPIDGYESCLQAVSLVQFVQWTYESELARSIAKAHGFQILTNSSQIHDQLRKVVCRDTSTNTVIAALDHRNEPMRPVPNWVDPTTNEPPTNNDTTNNSKRVLWMSCSMVVACVVIILLMRQVERRNSETTFWRIRKKDLVFAQPQVILGSGSFGQVLLASYRGTQVAVKRVVPNQVKQHDDFTGSGTVIQITNAVKCTKPGKCSIPSSHTQMGRKGLIEELRVLSRLRHNSITTVIGAVMESRGEPMIVMEYLEEGSLYNVLHHSFALDGEMLLTILQDIVQGLRFLHSADPPIIHSDLKSKNVLLDRRFRAKITDFGLSIASKRRACGTPFWMAPELLTGETKNNTASDIYAFGMVLYEIFTRKTPFQGENPDEILPRVRDWAIKLKPSPPYRISSPFRTLYDECLSFLPGQRPTAEELEGRIQRLNTSHLGTGIEGKTVDIKHEDLPEHIQQALRDGRDVPDEKKEVVTIVVADIHNLAQLQHSSQKRAAVIQELDKVFRELAATYELTIPQVVGDAFVAIANTGEGQSHDHAKRCAMMAIDLLSSTDKILLVPDDPSSDRLQLRIAVHCGPVTCRLIGNREPRIALYSEETIHFADILQISGQPGRIQCVHKTFCVLRRQMPDLKFALRGRVPVKGSAGTQNTYWINEGEAMPVLSPKKVTMPWLPKKKKSKHDNSLSPLPNLSPRRNSGLHRENTQADSLKPSRGYYRTTKSPSPLPPERSGDSSPIPRHSTGGNRTVLSGAPLASPYRRQSSLHSSNEPRTDC